VSRRKPHTRCPNCFLKIEHCLCVEIVKHKKSINVQTHIHVLMHHREYKLPTNTSRLASLLMPNCLIHLRGLPDNELLLDQVIPDLSQAILLYPCESSRELNQEFCVALKRPVVLIVPDGSWRQASKVAIRENYLKDIPRVHLPKTLPSRYFLRREPKDNGLATFEAIARTLGILESLEVQQKLENVFDEFVSRSLNSRGNSGPRSKLS